MSLRHLPVFGRSYYLRYRPKRYQCLMFADRPTTTQRLDWHDDNSAHTSGYDEHPLLQLVGATIEEVNIKERVAYDAVLEAAGR